MTMTELHTMDAADLERLERIARIGRELADAADKNGSAKWRPWQTIAATVTASGAVFGALGAILALWLRHT